MNPLTNEGLFRTIVDESILAMVLFDRNSLNCCYMNHIAQELLEYNEPDLSKLNLRALFPEETRGNFKPLSMDHFFQQGLYQDLIIKNHQGRNLVVTAGAKQIATYGFKYYALMFEDVTFVSKMQREITLKQKELTLAYQELLEQNQKLQELDLAKNRFLAISTHELRTPLSAIVATADILEHRIYDNQKQHDEFVKILFEESQHLLELVNDILDLTKIQAGKIEYYLESLSAKELLVEVIQNSHGMAKKKESSITLLPESCDDPCYFDPLRLKQVLTNIVGNAIKFVPQNGKIEILVERIEDTVAISIKDNGPGIDEANHGKIFNEFETIEQVTKHHKGTGLGLPISRKLIEAMGGKIDLESKLGHGAKFIVRLPTTKVLPDEFYRSRPLDDIVDLASAS